MFTFDFLPIPKYKLTTFEHVTNKEQVSLFLLELSLMRAEKKFRNQITYKITQDIKEIICNNIDSKDREDKEKYFKLKVPAKKIIDVILAVEQSGLSNNEINGINFLIDAIAKQINQEQYQKKILPEDEYQEY